MRGGYFLVPREEDSCGSPIWQAALVCWVPFKRPHTPGPMCLHIWASVQDPWKEDEWKEDEWREEWNEDWKEEEWKEEEWKEEKEEEQEEEKEEEGKEEEEKEEAKQEGVEQASPDQPERRRNESQAHGLGGAGCSANEVNSS